MVQQVPAPVTPGFEVVPHPADVGICFWAPDLPGAFVAAARGLSALPGGKEIPPGDRSIRIHIEGDDRQELLFNWLSEILYYFDGEDLLLSRCRIERAADNALDAVFISEALLEGIAGDLSLVQCVNVATLPGIVRASLAMPDIHQGYGFPIGGVAAMDEEAGGVVSPGGVGHHRGGAGRLQGRGRSRARDRRRGAGEAGGPPRGRGGLSLGLVGIWRGFRGPRRR